MPDSTGEMSSPPDGSARRGLSHGASLRERVRQAAKQMESEIIIQALEQHRWNRRRTAQALNISYRSLMYKMKNCDLRNGVVAGVERDEPEVGCGD